MLLPRGNRALDHSEHAIDSGRIDRREKLSFRRCDVEALPRRSWASASGIMPLLGYQSEEFAQFVAARLERAAIVRHWDEVRVDKGDNAGIGKDGRTARHAVVSAGSERMPVHGPEKKRLACRRGRFAPFQNRSDPRDLEPL